MTLRGWIHFKLTASSLGKDEQARRDFALWLASSDLRVESLTEIPESLAKTIHGVLQPMADDELEVKITEWRDGYRAQQVSLEDLLEVADQVQTGDIPPEFADAALEYQADLNAGASLPRQTPAPKLENLPGIPIPKDFELNRKLENQKLYHFHAFGVLFTVIRRFEECTWAAHSTLEGPDGYGTGSLESFFDWYRRNATREERAAALPGWDDLERLEFSA